MKKSRLSRLCQRVGERVSRSPWVALSSALVLTAVASVLALRLEIDADLVSLLPSDGAHTAVYREFLEDFGGLEEVYVLVARSDGLGEEVADEDGLLLEAAWRLEEKLRRSGLFREVRSGATEEDEDFILTWVAPQAAFLIGEDRFSELLADMSDEGMALRAERLRSLVLSPVGGGLTNLARHDPLGLAMELASKAGGRLPLDPLTGTFSSADGKSTLVIGSPSGGELSGEIGRSILELLTSAQRELRQELGEDGGSIELRPIGGPLYAAWDEAAIRGDLTTTLGLSLTLSLAVLALGLRSVRLPLVAALTLGAAGVWTLGILQLGVGSVVGLSLGFGAVLVGLGVDALIHGASRWVEHDDDEAAVAAASRAGPGIAVALLTTSAAFFVLVIASLRLVREIGLLVASGLLAVLLATLLVALPLAALADRRRAGRAHALARFVVIPSRGCVELAARRPRSVVAAFVVLLLLAIATVRQVEVSGDLAGFRPGDHPAHRAEQELLALFEIGSESAQVLVRGSDLDAALARAEEVATMVRGEELSGLRLVSPSDVLPSAARRNERSRRLASVSPEERAEALTAALGARGLRADAFAPGLERMRELGVPPELPPRSKWPHWLRQQVHEAPDGSATLLLSAQADSGEETVALARLLADRESVAVAGSALVGADLRRVAARDLRRLSAAAGLAILVVLVVAYGGALWNMALAALPLVAGGAAAVLVLVVGGRPLDLLGVAMLPVLLGIGVDDGVHATLGAASRGRAMIAKVREVAPAMTLTTLTTALGFGSLAASTIPSLAVAGVLVAVGVLACWAGAVMLVPAVAALGSTGGAESVAGESPDDSAAEGSSQAPVVSERRRRALGRFHWSGVFWYRLHHFGVRILPDTLMPPMTALFAFGFFLALGDVRRGISSNLAAVLGPASLPEAWRRSYRTLLNHSWCMNESYEGLQGGATTAPAVEGREHWDEVSARGRGFVLVTAHVGHWQLGSHLTESGRVARIHVVREPEIDEESQEFVEELLHSSGGGDYVVHFTHGRDPTLGARLLSALRRGEVVALQGDRPGAGGRSVRVELFGRPLEVPAGPAALARAAGAPLLPVFVFRSGRRRAVICFRPPIDVDSARPSREAVATAARRYAEDLEWAIRREPHQWFCLRSLWPRGTGGNRHAL